MSPGLPAAAEAPRRGRSIPTLGYPDLGSPWPRMDQRRRLPRTRGHHLGRHHETALELQHPFSGTPWKMRCPRPADAFSVCGFRCGRPARPGRTVSGRGDPAIVPIGVLSVVRLPLMASTWMKTEIAGVVGEVPIPGVRGRGFGRHSDDIAGQGSARRTQIPAEALRLVLEPFVRWARRRAADAPDPIRAAGSRLGGACLGVRGAIRRFRLAGA
jgi:hypothetical protein